MVPEVDGLGQGEFYAALNMELSDGWALSENKGDFDPTMRDPIPTTSLWSIARLRGWRLADLKKAVRPRLRSAETPRPFHQHLWR